MVGTMARSNWTSFAWNLSRISLSFLVAVLNCTSILEPHALEPFDPFIHGGMRHEQMHQPLHPSERVGDEEMRCGLCRRHRLQRFPPDIPIQLLQCLGQSLPVPEYFCARGISHEFP